MVVKVALGIALVASMGMGAAASPAGEAPMPFRIEKVDVLYQIQPDGSRIETRERAVKILTSQALEQYKQGYVTYSTSAEHAEILEAYTRKQDGRRIDAPKSNYQFDINKGRDSGGPAFSDRTRVSVIFPEVAVGDTVVLKHRVSEKEPLFPGHFSVNERFLRTLAFDDVRVRIETPAAMWSQHAVTAMAAQEARAPEGVRAFEWTWKNANPPKSKRRDFSAYDPDKEVGYSFSTFRHYGEIAEAYGQRARPKAVASERVRTLADEVTRGIPGPREQAKALYEWVATNIHYAGNCVGVGAVVPRDQEFVLDNKMGDCKDQATLLQALLAAKGIPSTQALVNSGSTYRLPKVPVISMVNHVIVYVPSLELFLDPTSSTTPFGMLPLGDSDKPVLLVDGYREGLRTPPTGWVGNRQHTRTEVKIAADGKVAGTVQVALAGTMAVNGRDRLRDATPEMKEQMMKMLYQRNNSTGFGRLESDDPKPLAGSFKYKVTFETEEFTQLPGPGAFTIQPLYMTEAPLHMVAAMTEEESEAEETGCTGGHIVEEYVYRLPKNMKVIAVPRNLALQQGSVSYKSSYQLKGNVLSVKREMLDKTERNVCSVAVQREFAATARKIVKDLGAQVVYQ